MRAAEWSRSLTKVVLMNSETLGILPAPGGRCPGCRRRRRPGPRRGPGAVSGMQKVLWLVPGLGVRVPSFGLAMLLACLASLALTVWRARRERLNPDTVLELAVWLMTGGFLGARALYLISHPDSWSQLTDLR